jgi:hypothetical protein
MDDEVSYLALVEAILRETADNAALYSSRPHRLFNEPRETVAAYYARLHAAYQRSRYHDQAFLEDLCVRYVCGVHGDKGGNEKVCAEYARVIHELIDDNHLNFSFPRPPNRDAATEGQLYAELDRLTPYLTHEQEIRDAFGTTVCAILLGLLDDIPKMSGTSHLSAPLYALINVPKVVQAIVASFLHEAAFDENTATLAFKQTRNTVAFNVLAASKLSFEQAEKTPHRIIAPDKSDLAPEQLIAAYLQGTPFPRFLNTQLPFSIDDETRFAHTWVLSAPGHGKTTFLAGMLVKDIERIKRGEASAVVIDSQNTIIPQLLWLDCPKVIINPKDTKFPIALNIFDVGLKHARDEEEYSSLLEGGIDMFAFLVSSLFEQPMTPRQRGLFEYVAEFLMTAVPDATVIDFRDFLDPATREPYKKHYANASPDLQRFLANEFPSSEAQRTASEVLPRLRPLLRRPVFRNLFASPKSRIDLGEEMNAGKLILIDADKQFLTPTGCKVFERFWLSQVNQAAIRRASQTKMLPTFVYVDEAQDALEGGDKRVENILDQARKRRIGLTIIHHRTAQLCSESLAEALDGSTATKITGTLNINDQASFARMMHTDINFLNSQQKRKTFALYADGLTNHAITVAFPNTALKPELNDEQFSVMIAKNREKYCYSPQTAVVHTETKPMEDLPQRDPKDWKS